MVLFLEPDAGLMPFIINPGRGRQFKVYGYPYTVYASSPLFWALPVPRFMSSRYITITIPPTRGFLWLWYHLNGIRPRDTLMNELGLSYDERIELWNLVKLFGVEKNYNVIYSFIDSVMIGTTPERILEIPDLLWDSKRDGYPIRGYRTLPIVHPGVREVGMFDTEYARRYLLSGQNESPFPFVPIITSRPGNAYILMWVDEEGLERYYITISGLPQRDETKSLLPLSIKQAEEGDLVQLAKTLLPDMSLDVSMITSHGKRSTPRESKDIRRRMVYGSDAFNMYSTSLDALMFALMYSGITISKEIIDEIVKTSIYLVGREKPTVVDIIDAMERASSEVDEKRPKRKVSTTYSTLYTATADIGDIKQGSTVWVFDGYALEENTWPEPLDNPFIPSLPREIYHYPLPSFFKFTVGPYLLEGSPATVRSRSPYFEVIAHETSKWTTLPVLEGEADLDALIYVWSYLNGITDGYSRPHYPLPYDSLLRCWNYISFFQIPLVSMFVDNYIRECFQRAPNHKDENVYRILKDINDKSPGVIVPPNTERLEKLKILGGIEK